MCIQMDPLPRVKLLCPHRILVTIQGYMLIYEIPSLQPIHPGGTPVRMSAKALGVSVQRGTAYEGHKPVWNYTCAEHQVTGDRISVKTNDWVRRLDFLTILPPVGQNITSDFNMIRIHKPIVIGPSQALWPKSGPGHAETNCIELSTCSSSTASEEHVGYMRLGKLRAPHSGVVSTVVVGGCVGYVEDISYVEEDGRIYMLCSPRGLMHRWSIVIVNLV